jgi:hypothetical protein
MRVVRWFVSDTFCLPCQTSLLSGLWGVLEGGKSPLCCRLFRLPGLFVVSILGSGGEGLARFLLRVRFVDARSCLSDKLVDPVETCAVVMLRSSRLSGLLRRRGVLSVLGFRDGGRDRSIGKDHWIDHQCLLKRDDVDTS